MVLRIITVGKISPWARTAWEHYKKLISRFRKVELLSLSTGGDLNRENPEVIKRREARRILDRILGTPVCLDIRGRRMTSEEFSRFLAGLRNATFIIGGPLGLDESVLKACRERISLSSFTLSHEVAFVLLLEQILRGFKIAGGERYHH